MTIDLHAELFEQLDWHWRTHLRPRLDGLIDDEYFWEPVPGWNVRRRGEGVATQVGAGDFVLDFDYPEPVPPPVTSIAWRLGHVIVGCFGMRTASHFDGPPMTHDSFEYAGSAAVALEQLDAVYDGWSRGVKALRTDGLNRPCGPAEGPFAASPLGSLVLHINREAIHHGAEIALLRDLYRARYGR
jgi:hypothetical protein